MELFYVTDLLSIWKNDPNKKIIYVDMFNGDSNVQLGGVLFNIHDPKLTVMSGFEYNVSLFLNDVSKIPISNQIITVHKAIYNLFGSGIYYKSHYIFK